MLTLSLIIPVYNEERHIRGCLEAIKKQTVMPDEVIVIDNNCTDRTAEIVKEYDFVTVISEEKQGRAHARNAGFNEATGELLGRIDADTRLLPNWVEQAQRVFTDKAIHGVTGLGLTPMIPKLRLPKTTMYARSYYWNVHGIFGTITMWGANMVIRSGAWQTVKDQVCTDDTKVHEDQDISLWMAGKGLKIIQDNSLQVYSDNQSFRYFPKLIYYTHLRNKTKKYHLDQGNLPVPHPLRISLPKRFGSHLLFIFGLVVGVVFFPIDFYMHSVRKDKTWFD